MQVVGDPTLRAKEVVEIRGISGLLSGRYFVNEVKHTISSSGYVCDLKLTRDATGTRRAATQQAQPQGGQPNRIAANTGGPLTAVPVTDPATGRIHVEYRRGGRPLGASDPEAQARSGR